MIPPALAVWILVVHVAATALAWVIARKRPAYAPVAWTLTFFLASDVIRYALHPAAPGPYAGWDRVAFHVRSILFIGWRFAIPALALRVFTARSPRIVLVPFALASLLLVTGYPTVRGQILQNVYLAIELACVGFSIGLSIMGFRGAGPKGLQHLVTGVIAISELVMIAGPYTGSIYLSWDRAWAILFVEYAALIATQGVACSRIYARR